MSRSKLGFVPDGPLLNTALEERRFIAQLLNEADQKSRGAAELRACAMEFEGDAATLREDAARRQARMSSLKIKQKAVVVKKDKEAGPGRKGKTKRVMKTAAEQKKMTGARPERMNAGKKPHEHDINLNNDSTSRSPIAPSNEQTAVWLSRSSYAAHRDNGAAYSKAYVLLPGELPMMSGGVLTTIDHPNFDASQLLHIETHVHLRSKEQDAAESRQFITAEEDRINSILADDNVWNSGSDKELALSEEDNAFVTQDLKDSNISMPLCDDVSSQGWFYDSQGSDYHYNSQIGVSQRRLLNDLL